MCVAASVCVCVRRTMVEPLYYPGFGWGIELSVLINGKDHFQRSKRARELRLFLLDTGASQPSPAPRYYATSNDQHHHQAHQSSSVTPPPPFSVASHVRGSNGWLRRKWLILPRLTYPEFVDRLSDPSCQFPLSVILELGSIFGFTSTLLHSINARLANAHVLQAMVFNSDNAQDGSYSESERASERTNELECDLYRS